jgi:hypothetical protein
MKTLSWTVLALCTLSASFAFATPIVGVKAIYDYKIEKDGKTVTYVMTKEVLSVDVVHEIFSEKTTFLDGEKVVQENTTPMAYSAYELPWDFGVKCLTSTLNGPVTQDGATIQYSKVTVPAGTFPVCRMTYVNDGMTWELFDADDSAFNEVKIIATDSKNGAVHTAELRSISKP